MRTTWRTSLRAHHRERYGWQQAGEATYLLAWEGRRLRGRLTLLKASKYEEVRAALGASFEVSAFTVRPTGRGVGTAMLAVAEQLARAAGARCIGLAVSLENPRAEALYRRLGYRDFGVPEVVDTWTERRRFRRPLEYAEVGRYLVKALD